MQSYRYQILYAHTSCAVSRTWADDKPCATTCFSAVEKHPAFLSGCLGSKHAPAALAHACQVCAFMLPLRKSQTQSARVALPVLAGAA